MKKTALNEIQNLFWTDLVNFRSDDTELQDHFSGPTREIGMEIYVDAYFLRIFGVLKEDFKDLHRLLGEEHFSILCRDYLKLTVSNHFSLRYMGGRFADFIAGNTISREFPWASELAAFEWAKADLFDGPDHQILKRSDLASMPHEAWARASFKLIPNFLILQTKYRIEDDFSSRPETLRVWRKKEDIFYAVSTPEEMKMLALLRTGRNFGEICEQMAENGDVETAAKTVYAILGRWIDDEIIESVSF